MRKTQYLFLLLLFILFLTDYSPQCSVKEYTLGNGLTILTETDKNSSLVSLNIFVKAGSADETKNEAGISHFLEHLFFRGVPGITGSEFKKQLEMLGGYANAETSRDYTRYYINLSSDNAEKGLELLLLALKNSSLNEDEIERERKVILEEYNIYKNSAQRKIADRIFELAYPDSTYSRSPIGTEKNIKNFSKSDLADFRQRFYRPSNLIFVLTGNFNEDSLTEKIKRAYANIGNAGENPKSKNFIFAPVAKTQETVIKEGSESLLIIGFYAPAANDKNLFAADVLCFLLGKGNNALFKKNITEKNEGITDIDVDFQTMKHEGLILIAVQYKNNTPAKVRDLINKEILSTASGNFSQEDLDTAKTNLLNSILFEQETNAARAASIGYYAAINKWTFEKEYPKNITAVTKKELTDFAIKLTAPPACIISVIPSKKDEEDD